MPSPIATNETHLAKPPENHLSDALRETLRNLDIKDAAPDVIIKRFNKSGGIDRVRIAVERRMKEFNEAQKRHTVAASAEFLNEAVPEGSEVPPPQKLMQQAQDVVLATVKDRIGRDVDSVTEQGKASWFLRCVQDEIINACKEDGTNLQAEEKPAPATKVVDGAKAILKNLTRNVARARQTDHGHDSARLTASKEQHAYGHVSTETNGKLSHDEKNQPISKGNQSRSETVDPDQKKASTTETYADRDQKEKKVPPRSTREMVPVSVRESEQEGRPSSGNTMPPKSVEQPTGTQSKAKAEVKEEPQPIQMEADVKDYDALADEILGGSEDDDITEQKASKAIETSISPPNSEVQDTTDKNPEVRTKTTTAPEKEGPTKPLQGSVLHSPTRETNEGTKTKHVEQPAASEVEERKPLDKVPKLESPEASKMDVTVKSEEKLAIADVQMAAEGPTSPGQHISGDENIQKDGIKPETTTKESHSAPEVPSEPRKIPEQLETDVARKSSEKETACEEEEKHGKEGNRVIKQEKATSDDVLKVTVEAATESISGVKVTEEKAEEKEKSHPSREQVQEVQERQTKPVQKNVSSSKQSDGKEAAKADKTDEQQLLTSGKEEVPTSAGNNQVANPRKVIAKPKKDGKPSRSDNDRPRRSETNTPQTAIRKVTSSTRRASRRLSSRTTPKDEPVASESKEAGYQKTTVAKKEKRPRGRAKQKDDDHDDVQREGKRKTAKSDMTKNRKELNEKKRRRSQTLDDHVSSQIQPSADRPDPAAENWPRGYGTVRTCVPEDFEAQQKVLHALEILIEKECATPFSEPVDTSEKGLELYASIIKNPMDLGEICKRLQNSSAERGYYLNVSEVTQDIDLVWWNCKQYNGQFDPIISQCEQSRHELAFLLEQHGIEVGKGAQKRRRVSRGSAAATRKSQEEEALGDNDGRLVGKTILIFTELEKRKKEWFSVDVKAYDAKSKSYTLRWIDKGKTTKKATFGLDKMYPVYRC